MFSDVQIHSLVFKTKDNWVYFDNLPIYRDTGPLDFPTYNFLLMLLPRAETNMNHIYKDTFWRQ